MATAKSYMFPEFTISLSLMAKALSHPARIAILKILADHGRINAMDFQRVIPLSKATISHHLRALKKGHFVVEETKGQEVIYQLNRANFGFMALSFTHLFDLELDSKCPINEEIYRIGLPLR